MKRYSWFAPAVLMWVCGGNADAAPSSQVAWTPETLRLVKNGNAEKGQQLAAGCQACHSEEPANAGTPNPYLAAQLATYLYRQLHDYKDGSRQNAIMSGIAGGLSDQDMADIAQWYSQQKPAGSSSDAAAAVPALVSAGDSKRLIPPCGICHGWEGQGEAVDTPRLAGQKASYLAQTLAAYQSGDRHNDIYRRMRAMSERLSQQEIKALADYYAAMK